MISFEVGFTLPKHTTSGHRMLFLFKFSQSHKAYEFDKNFKSNVMSLRKKLKAICVEFLLHEKMDKVDPNEEDFSWVFFFLREKIMKVVDKEINHCNVRFSPLNYIRLTEISISPNVSDKMFFTYKRSI